ncbi:MAG TPA: response regulator [Planctomycetota bacterium]|nr:response regulator [Planctomycetota bacterium]
MSEKKRVAVVIEDDAPIRRFLKVTLEENGFKYVEADTAKKGLIQCETQMPDLIILDLGLPDMDGLEVIELVREWTKVPIVVLSARGKEKDKVEALDAGADDYLTKPFGVDELLARIRVALRHSARTEAATGETSFRYRGLEVDLEKRVVTVSGKEVHLTPIEYRLLATLVKHAGKVLTHKQLLVEVWGPNAEFEHQYVRVYMNQLRHKIEPEPARPKYLITETGVGYRLKTT